MIYQLPKSSYSYWRVGVLFEGPFFPVSIPKRNMNLFIGPLPLGEKVSYDFTTVSLSVGKCVFSKIAHRIFMGIIPANTSKIWFFWFCKKNNWCLYFFGFKSCTIMTNGSSNFQTYHKLVMYLISQKLYAILKILQNH